MVSPLPHSSRQTCLPRLRIVPDDGRGRRNLEPVWSRNIAGDHESDQTDSRLHNWEKVGGLLPGPERNGTRRRVSSREDTNCTRGDAQGCATSSGGNSPPRPGHDNEFQLVPTWTDLRRALSTLMNYLFNRWKDVRLPWNSDTITRLVKLGKEPSVTVRLVIYTSRCLNTRRV